MLAPLIARSLVVAVYAALHESAFGPKLPLAALRRNVGKSRKSGPNANFDSGRACPLCPDISDFNLFRYRQRVVHLNAKISDGTFDLGMAKQKLYGPQVAGSPVDQRCLCPTQ